MFGPESSSSFPSSKQEEHGPLRTWPADFSTNTNEYVYMHNLFCCFG